MMEETNEKLRKHGIEIRFFTPELENDAIQMNREEGYTIRASLRMAFRAPFLHVLAALWVVIFWKALALVDLPIAIVLGYPMAIATFLYINQFMVVMKLCNIVDISEVHAAEKGAMLVAMDVTKEPPYVAGMIGINPSTASHAEIVRFLVRTPYRRMGIAKGLMATAFQFAVEEGFATIEAEIWDVATEFKLFPMYSAQGFRRHGSEWVPYWWMPMYRAEILIKDLRKL